MDLISRQAAITVADSSDYVGLSVEDVKKVTDEVVKGLKRLPSAQPDLDEVYAHAETEAEARFHTQQRWIPCSERLPSEGENVLLCDTRFGKVAIGKLIRYNTSCCWEVDHWDCDIEDWQAWMPLPEPYAERREE